MSEKIVKGEERPWCSVCGYATVVDKTSCSRCGVGVWVCSVHVLTPPKKCIDCQQEPDSTN
jgi:hypothetical protein